MKKQSSLLPKRSVIFTAAALSAAGGWYALGGDSSPSQSSSCEIEEIAANLNAVYLEYNDIGSGKYLRSAMESFNKCGETVQLQILSITYGQTKLTRSGYQDEILDAIAAMSPQGRIDAVLNQSHQSAALRASSLVTTPEDAPKMMDIIRGLPLEVQEELLIDEELPRALIDQGAGMPLIELLRALPQESQEKILTAKTFDRNAFAQVGYDWHLQQIMKSWTKEKAPAAVNAPIPPNPQ